MPSEALRAPYPGSAAGKQFVIESVVAVGRLRPFPRHSGVPLVTKDEYFYFTKIQKGLSSPSFCVRPVRGVGTVRTGRTGHTDVGYPTARWLDRGSTLGDTALGQTCFFKYASSASRTIRDMLASSPRRMACNFSSLRRSNWSS